ncbi:hypothetical protein QR680_001959 [Steinernema hermaphroditum]|uniref:SURP motif domain-containing protein n=1 Tax=Steinernema hermaphroditum TaxID=289476 RepID=A0AA39LH76_9BILA|nr:hypothetical protein QR680_001959 [Steinernema hermaphroditum]
MCDMRTPRDKVQRNWKDRSSPQMKSKNKTDEGDEMVVFGYSCKLFPTDGSSASEESRLISHTVDGESLNVDRYDCRLHLTTFANDQPGNAVVAGDNEEAKCDEERYRDMHTDIEMEKDCRRSCLMPNGVEIGFSYDSTETTVVEGEESELEPYEIPKGFKLPVGVTKPETQNQHNVIEKTARYVVKHGPQMEIVIKARQQIKSDKFGFLEFDNPLNAYYKVVLKHMKEGRYPTGTEKGNLREKPQSPSTDKPVNALEAIAFAHGSSDSEEESDEEGYLHPSLMAAPRTVQASNSDAPLIGPLPQPPVVTKVAPIRWLSSANKESVYKQLSNQFIVESDARDQPKDNTPLPSENLSEKTKLAPHSEPLVPDFSAWYRKFYGRDCQQSPCTDWNYSYEPSQQTVMDSTIAYVAKRGQSSEDYLRKNDPGLKLRFLVPEDPTHSDYVKRLYMHCKGIRTCQESSTVPEGLLYCYQKIGSLTSAFQARRKRKCTDSPDEMSDLLECPSSSDGDPGAERIRLMLQQQRREKARQFMASILQKKRAEKEERKSVLRTMTLVGINSLYAVAIAGTAEASGDRALFTFFGEIVKVEALESGYS